jgi:hypothetical protein
VVTRRGKEVVVALSADEYRRLTGKKMGLADGPDFSLLELARSKELAREVEL